MIGPVIGTVSMTTFWLIAVIVFLIIEGAVPGLVSIWFAAGALAALISAAVKAPLWLQFVWFVVISVAALVLTRPLAKKYINSRVQPTNADMLIGKECIVTEPIDNIAGTGAVKAGGIVWTARSAEDKASFEPGERVRALRIEGVKLIVEKIKMEETA